MGNIQVKNVPEALHEELRRRAHLRGSTVRDYVLGLIEKDQALPSKEDWLARVRHRAPVGGGMSGADLVREQRGDRERELGQRHGA